ncbi:MAG TPA: M56 family metallopeptidase [Pyrinomonadaceae bacterium]
MNILFGQLDSVPRSAIEALLNSLWQSAVLALLVWLLLRLFKRARATTKYSVWLATLLAIISLPFLHAPTSSRTPATNAVALSVNRAPETYTSRTILPEESLQPPIKTHADAKEDARAQESGSTASSSVNTSGVSYDGHLEMAATSRLAQEGFTFQLRGERWPQLFFILWLMGIALMMVRLIRSYLSTVRLKESSRPLAEKYQRRMGHWLKTCGIRRAVELRGSQKIGAPLVLGLRKKVILFPERLGDDLTVDEFDQVLLHELAHVRRFDDWSNLFQRLVEAVLFFHPIVLWLGRQLDAEREIACDQWAVARTGGHRSYATCLAKLFELTKSHSSPLLAHGAITARSHLSRRIEAILKSKRNSAPRLAVLSLLIPLALLFVMLIQLGRISPVIAVTAPGTSATEAEQTSLAGATHLEQSRPPDVGINIWPGNLTRGIETGGEVQLLSGAAAMTPMARENSASDDSLGLPATQGGATQTHSWPEIVEASGNISSVATQPIFLFSPADGQRQEISSNLVQVSMSDPPAVQEQRTSSATLSSDEGPLPADFFEKVAALGNSGSQRELLSALLKRRGLSRETFIKSLVAAKSIDSDGEKAEFLVSAARLCTGETEVLNAYFNAVSSIDSAGERRRVLSALLTLKGHDQGILIRTLKAAAPIDSDGEKAELLVKAASLYTIGSSPLDAFLDAVSSISSSAEQRRALTALLRQRNLTSEVAIQTVRFARRISSDGEKAEFLVRVTEICPANDGLLSAYMATASSIHSALERARALSAIAKKRGISQESQTPGAALARNNGDRD